MPTVWIFNGAQARLPAAVFSTRELGEAWIAKHGLSGMLTEYPLDVGVYEWALTQGWFTPKAPQQQSPDFISRFTSASLTHYHYDDGVT